MRPPPSALADAVASRTIPLCATAALVVYSWAGRKLTPGGLGAGVLVAGVHLLHPWPAFFWLLAAFFVLGTAVTKIGRARKAHLTQSPTGGPGGDTARSATQVFANSALPCLLLPVHAYLLHHPHPNPLRPLLPLAIIAHYAAAAADTSSSELGILSPTPPVLITAPTVRVSPGTNGAVTPAGLAAALAAAALLVALADRTLHLTAPHAALSPAAAALLIAAGLLGSLVDSVVGALAQVTVTDARTGRVVEGQRGGRVRGAATAGKWEVRGRDVLTNNGVNLVMAGFASGVAMGVGHVWGLGIDG